MTAPTYLARLLAPVDDEIDTTNLQVTGSIPAELTGRYFRNGPNPVSPGQDPGHWFAGPGVLHGIRARRVVPQRPAKPERRPRDA